MFFVAKCKQSSLKVLTRHKQYAKIITADREYGLYRRELNISQTILCCREAVPSRNGVFLFKERKNNGNI